MNSAGGCRMTWGGRGEIYSKKSAKKASTLSLEGGALKMHREQREEEPGRERNCSC